MISPVFILCSVLLLTGTFAHPNPDSKKYTDAAIKGGLAMFGDILQGKDIQQAIADRGMEALGSLDPDVLKVIEGLRNGQSLEDVFSKAGGKVLSRAVVKYLGLEDFVNYVGEDNLKMVWNGGAKVAGMFSSAKAMLG